MNPPDCQVHFCAQRSPEWFELRRGYLTATDFGPWLIEKPEVRLTIKEIQAELDRLGIAYPSKGLKDEYVALLPDITPYLSYTKTRNKAWESALGKVLAGIAGLWEAPTRETEAMRRGTELEPDAVAAFEAWSGHQVTQVGFCASKFGRFGCSPDGLINTGDSVKGLESKVPEPSTHIVRRRAAVLPYEHLYQVHGCMAVTGCTSWFYQNWNPGLASLRIEVQRDAFTDDLFAGLKAFSADVDRALAEESAAWESEFQSQPELSAA